MSIQATAVWDSTTVLNTALTQTGGETGGLLITIIQAGTVTIGQVTFEVSDDNVNWYPLPGFVQNTFAIFTTWQPSFGSPVALQFAPAGFSAYRVRLSTVLTGTGNVTINMTLVNSAFTVVEAAVQQFGPNLHMTLDDSAGGNPVNTVAKGTQAARALGVQDLKDSGRVIKVYSATFTAATTEALITLTPISDGTAGGTGTSFTVTSGKRFRIQTMTVSTRNAGAVIQGVVCNLRMSASGAVTATSPLVATVGAGTISATANNVGAEAADVPDGLELSGTMQFGISQVGTATAGNTVTLIGYEY